MNGAVLAGGTSSRMNHRDKSELLIEGEPFLKHIVSKLSDFKKVYVISNRSREDFPGVEASFHRDLIPGIGPLGGIYTALSLSEEEKVFVTTCDMPLISGEAVKSIVRDNNGFDLVVPIHKGKYEMLFALYSRKCLPRMEEMISQKMYKITGIFEDRSIQVKKIPIDSSFIKLLTNINTPEEYDRLSRFEGSMDF